MSDLQDSFPNSGRFGPGELPKMRPGDNVVAALPPIIDSIEIFLSELRSRAPTFSPSEAEQFLIDMNDYVFVGKLVSRRDESILIENRFGERRRFPIFSLLIVSNQQEVP